MYRGRRREEKPMSKKHRARIFSTEKYKEKCPDV
jgi:hypothetical protein